MPSFRPEARIAAPLAVLVAVGAPFLGGSTEPWNQGLVLAVFALGFCIAPPDRAPHRYATLGLLAALLLAGMSFFPSGAFGESKARSILEEELGIPLALTISPQPWISLEGIVLVAGGLLWWWWLITVLEPASEDRARVAQWTTAGIIILGAVALAEQAKWFKIPLWADLAPLGPFPNKNHMGDLLGTWSVVAVACGVTSLRKRRATCVLWFAGAALLLWANLGTASRGGLATCVGGVVIWGLIEAAYAKRIRDIGIAAAAGLCILAMFFAFGGATFQRSLRFFAAIGEADTPDFRLPIFRDALQLIRESPWCGWGIGNFEPVFTLYRHASAYPVRTLHPESDWLWLVSEMGWMAPIIAGLLLVPSLRQSFKPSRAPGAPVLRAAAVGGIMFVIHGLVDVSGHVLGSALPGLMLLALGATVPTQERGTAFARNCFRIVGVVLAVVGLAWLAAQHGKQMLPGSIGVNLALEQSINANASEQFSTAEEIATRGLDWAPLDFGLYFQRAVARLYQSDIDGAQQDFRRSRRLEPSHPSGPYQEGELWAYFDPPRSEEPWAAALERISTGATGRAGLAGLYARMLEVGKQRPEVKPVLGDLSRRFPELRLKYLEMASPEELAAELPTWLESPEQFARRASTEREHYFALWRRVPDRQILLQFLDNNPQYLREGWRPAAEYKVQQGDTRGAVMLAFKALPPPPLPQVQESTLDAARRDFVLDPSNVAAGYRTFRAEVSQGMRREALATLDKLARLPKPPAYLPYLRAQILAELEDWNAAWKEIQRYRADLYSRKI